MIGQFYLIRGWVCTSSILHVCARACRYFNFPVITPHLLTCIITCVRFWSTYARTFKRSVTSSRRCAVTCWWGWEKRREERNNGPCRPYPKKWTLSIEAKARRSEMFSPKRTWHRPDYSNAYPSPSSSSMHSSTWCTVLGCAVLYCINRVHNGLQFTLHSRTSLDISDLRV